MRLTDRLAQDGETLFRWRSYLPLVLLPALLVALVESERLLVLMGETGHHLYTYACIALSLAGFALRCATIGVVPAGTSGRNTHGQVADVLNTTGLYSVVRNPLYLGNVIMILGVVLATKVWWLVALVALAFWLYIERIIAAEERYLAGRFGETYLGWAEKTPAFIPRWRNWRAPDHRFSLRTVLKREHYGLLGLASAFLATEIALDLVIGGQDLRVWLVEDWVWLAFFAVALVASVALRLLKKTTGLLLEPGR